MGMIVAFILITCFITLVGISIGERYAVAHPESKFTKWWRKHLIGDGNEDDFDDRWTSM